MQTAIARQIAPVRYISCKCKCRMLSCPTQTLPTYEHCPPQTRDIFSRPNRRQMALQIRQPPTNVTKNKVNESRSSAQTKDSFNGHNFYTGSETTTSVWSFFSAAQHNRQDEYDRRTMAEYPKRHSAALRYNLRLTQQCLTQALSPRNFLQPHMYNMH